MTEETRDRFELGALPADDGWGWLYRVFDRLAPPGSRRRRATCGWFYPTRLERWRAGQVYRLLGVHRFGAIIPTGGILVRRLTGAKMAPYTLAGSSLRAAKAFYYRACVFEALHTPFFLALVVLAAVQWRRGRPDLALQDTAVNLVANAFPMLHHRRTRARIVQLANRRLARGAPESPGAGRKRGPADP